MQLTQKHQEYWHRNLKMTAFLLRVCEDFREMLLV